MTIFFFYKVKVFSQQYKTISVIAASDTVSEHLRTTMMRPWIVSEVRLFHQNPTRAIYAGHNR